MRFFKGGFTVDLDIVYLILFLVLTSAAGIEIFNQYQLNKEMKKIEEMVKQRDDIMIADVEDPRLSKDITQNLDKFSKEKEVVSDVATKMLEYSKFVYFNNGILVLKAPNGICKIEEEGMENEKD